jgi:two-component system, NtrC family, response regulator AtoC
MKILVVDDEQGLRQTVSMILREDGHDVEVADNGGSALERLRSGDFDLVLCDVRMPVLDGPALLKRYTSEGGSALVIMMSAYGDDEAALEAIRSGAYDYISKPFRADQLLLVVRKAVEREGLRREVRQLREELNAARSGDGMVGNSESLRNVVAMARRAAAHPTTVLITGESGTGKELLARLVHRESPRAGAPFVAVNCGAIPESLLESELFGHAKGAFTGATAARDGLFQEADGGTIFLDEIGELPQQLQVKLLRALQEGEIRRVGDNAVIPVNVRVLAATARALESEVEAGTFRQDLFYRLNVVRLHIPPLRERPEDLGDLAAHFVVRHNERLGLSVRAPGAEVIRALAEHSWPGNVRELENLLERAMVLGDGRELDAGSIASLVSEGRSAGGGRNWTGGRAGTGGPSDGDGEVGDDDLSVKRRSIALERALIARALERTGGNRTRAAQLLELSHRALLYKIREYGLGE